MRKLRDKNLFFYKSSKIYELMVNETSDMRQPIVITDSDIKKRRKIKM